MVTERACRELASVRNVSLRYGQRTALDGVTLVIPAAGTVGLIGPDGVGKSSLLALLAGARGQQDGTVRVLGGDMASKAHREAVCFRIAYMPQGLGKSLYPTLSVEENLQFFARIFGHGRAERRRRIDELTASTGLYAFLQRPAGKLSGGMKQKLGLCCALIHDPDLLILDEPTTGVDPLARSQFWDLIGRMRCDRPALGVVVATAYMEEAQRFDWLVAMDEGRVLAEGTASDLLARSGARTLDAAFMRLLPDSRRRGHREIIIPPLAVDDEDISIEARDLTMRFGDFVAVDRVSFRIRRGEIFGFLGSNGCGKTTTMKMLTGLLPASEGRAWLFGREVAPHDMATRRRVGYMSQAFSLYGELTVRQNLVLHAQLFHVPGAEIARRVDEMAERFGLRDVLTTLPDSLPLGMRQRLSLAVSMVHRPEILILDEPTSGVDPIARDSFWHLLIGLSRRDKVTIFISTHFMNEAQRCDRISMMHAGQVLDSDTPANLTRKRRAGSLEEAFIGYLTDVGGAASASPDAPRPGPRLDTPARQPVGVAPFRRQVFSLRRMFSYSWREALELRRDSVRATMALAGSVILMFVIGFGINMDVENLSYAVLDRDQTILSHNYALDLSGSRYFIERPPVTDYQDMDRRMRSGELSLAIEIPPGFARDAMRGRDVQVGAWIDGAMPMRAETVRGYVEGIHQLWLAQQAREWSGASPASPLDLQTRYRYNPDVRSLTAIVPAVIPLLMLMLPAMLTALAVVREKELGSIVHLYVTPVTRTEFLLGKQLPYVGLAMVNFFLMSLMAITAFDVPITGNYPTLVLGAFLFSIIATGMGLFASAITRSQIAAMFFAVIGTLIPATQFCGMLDPVSSLEGIGRLIGDVYPATHMFIISRGVFSKALEFADLRGEFLPMLATVPVIMGAAIVLLKKQGA